MGIDIEPSELRWQLHVTVLGVASRVAYFLVTVPFDELPSGQFFVRTFCSMVLDSVPVSVHQSAYLCSREWLCQAHGG